MARIAAMTVLFLAAGATAAVPAAAQSFSVGVGVGSGYGHHHGRRHVYNEPPPFYAPYEPPVVYSMMPPDAVFDSLEERGYREFSPMAFRDGVYKLNAVNRRGDVVALEVNVVTAEIMRELVLAEHQGRRHVSPAPVAPVPAPSVPETPPADGRDPLVVY